MINEKCIFCNGSLKKIKEEIDDPEVYYVYACKTHKYEYHTFDSPWQNHEFHRIRFKNYTLQYNMYNSYDGDKVVCYSNHQDPKEVRKWIKYPQITFEEYKNTKEITEEFIKNLAILM